MSATTTTYTNVAGYRHHTGRYGVVRYPEKWAVIDKQAESSYANVVSWHRSSEAAHARATRLNNHQRKEVTA